MAAAADPATLGFSMLASVIFVLVALVIHVSVRHHFEGQDRKAWEGKLELIGHILDDWHTANDAKMVYEQLSDAMVGHHSLLVRVEDPISGFRFVSGHADIPPLTAATRPTRETAGAFRSLAWSGANGSFKGIATL